MKALARALVSAALLAAALYALDWGALLGVARETDALRFSGAVALALASFVFLTLRWLGIVGARVPAPAIEHWRVYFHASFLNSFTPANIGGDVYRVAALRAHAPGVVEIVIALARERLFGLLSFLVGYVLCLAALGLFLPAAYDALDPLFVLALVAVVPAILALAASARALHRAAAWRLLARREGLRRRLEQLARAMVWRSPADFLRLLGYSLLALGAWIGAVALIAGDLGIELALPLVGAIAILTELVRLVPVSLQGIGLREGSFSVLVGLAGGSPESGFVLGAWSYLALSLALLACGPIAWGIGWAARRRVRRR